MLLFGSDSLVNLIGSHINAAGLIVAFVLWPGCYICYRVRQPDPTLTFGSLPSSLCALCLILLGRLPQHCSLGTYFVFFARILRIEMVYLTD